MPTDTSGTNNETKTEPNFQHLSEEGTARLRKHIYDQEVDLTEIAKLRQAAEQQLAATETSTGKKQHFEIKFEGGSIICDGAVACFQAVQVVQSSEKVKQDTITAFANSLGKSLIEAFKSFTPDSQRRKGEHPPGVSDPRERSTTNSSKVQTEKDQPLSPEEIATFGIFRNKILKTKANELLLNLADYSEGLSSNEVIQKNLALTKRSLNATLGAITKAAKETGIQVCKVLFRHKGDLDRLNLNARYRCYLEYVGDLEPRSN